MLCLLGHQGLINRTFPVVVACLLLTACSGSDNNNFNDTMSCDRSADEASRVQTAQALVTIDASNYDSLINYWAKDITHKEPVHSSQGREELRDYLSAMFGGSAYGFSSDRQSQIRDELYRTEADGSMTYMATLLWSGSYAGEAYTQTAMSILKFDPDEGCPGYQRDYYSEGDSWWNNPAEKQDVATFRGVYIVQFGLTERCFDEDGDGYTKYENAEGCANPELDCNDFVAAINPGAVEIPGNGVDDDCNALTPTGSPDRSLRAYQ